MKFSVLLDTSFFIRLLNDEDPLHINARNYFRYFLNNEIPLVISTISIAEYCVRGNLSELPLRNLQILPFNLNHAKKAGEFAKIIYSRKGILLDQIEPRPIIINDAKLFAQADVEPTIAYFVTSDSRSGKIINLIKQNTTAQFDLLDISKPYNEVFGILDL